MYFMCNITNDRNINNNDPEFWLSNNWITTGFIFFYLSFDWLQQISYQLNLMKIYSVVIRLLNQNARIDIFTGSNVFILQSHTNVIIIQISTSIVIRPSNHQVNINMKLFSLN